MRRVLSAGAPMTPAILERAQAMVPLAELHTPYGATEALPVASVGSHFLLEHGVRRTRDGAGVCVGKPVAGQDVRIIRIDDGPIAHWSDALLASPGEIGEITVRGPTVTARYHERPEATALAKIDHGDGQPVRHRMGDLGYLDDDGRLWFCGRKSQRVRVGATVHHTVPVEEVFNAHPDVKRTALVQVGQGADALPVLCVEREPASAGKSFELLKQRSHALGAERPVTREVSVMLEHPSSRRHSPQREDFPRAASVPPAKRVGRSPRT